jgi:hypothetical protein
MASIAPLFFGIKVERFRDVLRSIDLAVKQADLVWIVPLA